VIIFSWNEDGRGGLPVLLSFVPEHLVGTNSSIKYKDRNESRDLMDLQHPLMCPIKIFQSREPLLNMCSYPTVIKVAKYVILH
jgi:hypothetical protein